MKQQVLPHEKQRDTIYRGRANSFNLLGPSLGFTDILLKNSDHASKTPQSKDSVSFNFFPSTRILLALRWKEGEWIGESESIIIEQKSNPTTHCQLNVLFTYSQWK